MTVKKTKAEQSPVSNDDRCEVIAGVHQGKSGRVADLKTSKGGNVTITVVQKNGERFKTLARNVKKVKKHDHV